MTENSMRQSVTMDEIKSKKYLSLKIGESIEVTIDKLEKVKVDQEFALSKVEYRYELTTTDGDVLSIGSWRLWGAIRQALSEVEHIEGTRLSIIHLGQGEYSAKVV